MRIIGIVWLDYILEKLYKKHDVSQDEIKEILNGDPKFRFVEKGIREGENVYAALGRTLEGRYLILFFIYKKNGYIVIVSCRDMSTKEKLLYAKK